MLRRSLILSAVTGSGFDSSKALNASSISLKSIALSSCFSMANTRRDKAATVRFLAFRYLQLSAFRLPRENAAGGYKYGHCRKKQAELHHWWHGGVSVARTPFG